MWRSRGAPWGDPDSIGGEREPRGEPGQGDRDPLKELGRGSPPRARGTGTPEGGGAGVAGARRGRAPFPAGRFTGADGAMAAAAG